MIQNLHQNNLLLISKYIDQAYKENKNKNE